MSAGVDVLLLRDAEQVLRVHGPDSTGMCRAFGCPSFHASPCLARRWALRAVEVARGGSWAARWTTRHDRQSLGLLAMDPPPRMWQPGGIGLLQDDVAGQQDTPWLWSNDPDATCLLPVLAVATR